jgi:hypothetical protein
MAPRPHERPVEHEPPRNVIIRVSKEASSSKISPVAA